MVKVCAIYVRKSKINDNSDSMETQIQMCTEYLERKYKGCLIKIYDKDYGVTGHSIEKKKKRFSTNDGRCQNWINKYSGSTTI